MRSTPVRGRLDWCNGLGFHPVRKGKSMAPNSAGVVDTSSSQQGRKARLGAQVGVFVDMFDLYLPVIALAPATVYFGPQGMSESNSRLVAAAVFSATVLGRPLGALVFGHLSDRRGRRNVTILSLVGFGLCTLLIGFLPGFREVGIIAVVLLIALRFLNGVFLGGQYTAGTPLALEQSEKRRRGFNGAVIMTGFPMAYCAVSLLTFVLLLVIPSGGIDSAYTQWGWRISFVIGGLLALGWAWWYFRHVHESEAWIESSSDTKSGSPVTELFRGSNLRGFLQVFVLMSGIWFSYNMIGPVFPGVLRRQGGLTDTTVTVVLVIAYAALVPVYLAVGSLSQRIGRRRYFLFQGLLTAVCAPALFGLISSGRLEGLVVIVLVTVALVMIVGSEFAVASTYLIERFHVGIRSSGYGLGYTVAVIIPAFYATYLAGLERFMPYEFTPLVLLGLGGVLIGVGALWGPETRDVDLNDAATEPSADTSLLSGSVVGLPTRRLRPTASTTKAAE